MEQHTPKTIFSQKDYRSDKKKSHNRKSVSQSHRSSKVKPQNTVVTYMLTEDDEGAVSIPYELWTQPIKTFIKGKGARWCPVFKVWKVTRVQLELIKRDFPSILPATYEEPPFFVKLATQQLQNHVKILCHSYKKLQTSIKDCLLYDKLYLFQKQTLSFALSRHGRILIADEMGVGKSLQSLACCLLFPEKFPLLIISPSALKHVWRDQILKWYKHLIDPSAILVLKKGVIKQGQLQQIKIVIVSYQLATKLTKQFLSFQTVICDEAHYLKNPQTTRCSQLLPFLSNRKRIFLLTGTPALAKPKQLFNLLHILRPDVFKKLDQFGKRYCIKRPNPWTHRMEYDGAKNLAELHYILKKTIMIRRLKSQVLSELPSKQRQVIQMQTQKSVVSEIKELLSSNFSVSSIRQSDKLMNFFTQTSQNTQSQSIMRCYMLSSIAKLQSVKEYISAILENQIKIIIFAHHKAIMNDLQLHLKSLKCHYIRLDGDVTPQTRKKKVDNFQEDPNVTVALLSVTAMGTGFTLTAASTVLFAQLHWTPAILMQAQDRSHRIGQKTSVNIHYLIGDNTLDPIMLRHLQKKIGTVAKVLDGQSQSLKVQVLKKGELGHFEVQKDNLPSKNKRITDYFFPKDTKTIINQQNSLPDKFQDIKKLQEQKNEQQSQDIQNDLQIDKANDYDDSNDSLIMNFLSRKKKEAKQKY